MKEYTIVKGFLDRGEVERLLGLLERYEGLYRETSGRGGLGPRYRIIDGNQVRSHLPEVATLGEERLRAAAERFAGHPLQLMENPLRSIRVQAYNKRDQGFRWHFDEYAFVALLTLKNTNGGQTQFVSPRISRTLKFLFYPLYAFPRVFSLLPHRGLDTEAGDLLLMRGSRVLHRGVTLEEGGERILVSCWYDEPGKRPNPVRELVARVLNF